MTNHTPDIRPDMGLTGRPGMGDLSLVHSCKGETSTHDFAVRDTVPHRGKVHRGKQPVNPPDFSKDEIKDLLGVINDGLEPSSTVALAFAEIESRGLCLAAGFDGKWRIFTNFDQSIQNATPRPRDPLLIRAIMATGEGMAAFWRFVRGIPKKSGGAKWRPEGE